MIRYSLSKKMSSIHQLIEFGFENMNRTVHMNLVRCRVVDYSFLLEQVYKFCTRYFD